MTDQQILEKAVKKARDQGWKAPWGNGRWYPQEYSVEEILYNHDFAKALWGVGSLGYDEVYESFPEEAILALPIFGRAYTDGYKYHLQQMVIADDPIIYLGEHLGE